MAWRQPKRNGKGSCGHRGQCSCQRRVREEIARETEAGRYGTCTVMHVQGPCNQTIRGGKCPCPDC
jgi:hypothetical protein